MLFYNFQTGCVINYINQFIIIRITLKSRTQIRPVLAQLVVNQSHLQTYLSLTNQTTSTKVRVLIYQFTASNSDKLLCNLARYFLGAIAVGGYAALYTLYKSPISSCFCHKIFLEKKLFLGGASDLDLYYQRRSGLLFHALTTGGYCFGINNVLPQLALFHITVMI